MRTGFVCYCYGQDGEIYHKEWRLNRILHVWRHKAEPRLGRVLGFARLSESTVRTEAEILHAIHVLDVGATAAVKEAEEQEKANEAAAGNRRTW